MITRRSFLKGGTAMVAMGAATPGVFGKAVGAGIFDGQEDGQETPAKTLILVQMAGGADGLSMVLPPDEGQYRSLRRNLAVPERDVLRWKGDGRSLNVHPALAPLAKHWEAGRLAVIEGVGYPNPDYSHFTSMRIWQTANPDHNPDLDDGWLGRRMAELEARRHDAFRGVAVGSYPPTELTSDAYRPLAITSPDDYSLALQGDDAYHPERRRTMMNLYESFAKEGEFGALLQRTFSDTLDSSEALRPALEGYKPAVTYPEGAFGDGLKLLAALIATQPSMRVGHLQLDGFDTHEKQNAELPPLLHSFAAGLQAFYADLAAHGKAKDVIVMSWSEFGRRVEQNESGGTDHGSAGPLFVFGDAVRGRASYGEPVELRNLDDGNLRYTTDFRRVYATLFERWFQVEPAPLLGGKFAPLNFLSPL